MIMIIRLTVRARGGVINLIRCVHVEGSSTLLGACTWRGSSTRAPAWALLRSFDVHSVRCSYMGLACTCHRIVTFMYVALYLVRITSAMPRGLTPCMRVHMRTIACAHDAVSVVFVWYIGYTTQY